MGSGLNKLRTCREPDFDKCHADGGLWKRRSRQLAIVSAFAATSLGIAGVSPAAAVDCVDTDGDGWGWDGSTSCELGDSSSVPSVDEANFDDANSSDRSIEPTVGPCVDSAPFDDAWGWNGFESCRLDRAANPDAICLDSAPFGDGWGWDGVQSCELTSSGDATISDRDSGRGFEQQTTATDRDENEAFTERDGLASFGTTLPEANEVSLENGLPLNAVEVPAASSVDNPMELETTNAQGERVLITEYVGIQTEKTFHASGGTTTVTYNAGTGRWGSITRDENGKVTAYHDQNLLNGNFNSFDLTDSGKIREHGVIAGAYESDTTDEDRRTINSFTGEGSWTHTQFFDGHVVKVEFVSAGIVNRIVVNDESYPVPSLTAQEATAAVNAIVASQMGLATAEDAKLLADWEIDRAGLELLPLLPSLPPLPTPTSQPPDGDRTFAELTANEFSDGNPDGELAGTPTLSDPYLSGTTVLASVWDAAVVAIINDAATPEQEALVDLVATTGDRKPEPRPALAPPPALAQPRSAPKPRPIEHKSRADDKAEQAEHDAQQAADEYAGGNRNGEFDL